MRKLIILLVVAASFAACEKENPTPIVGIDGISLENFPKLDGSTSNEPLMRIITCKLLGYKYGWRALGGTRYVYSNDFPEIYELVKTSQTHSSIINLIDGTSDVVLSARTMSPNEKQYADNKGVALIAMPIALDAFIFMVNAKNPVTSLTHDQILRIYTRQYMFWNEVGGNNNVMHPYVRNQDSGSQELMESLVMRGTPIAHFNVDYEPTIFGMPPTYDRLSQDENGILPDFRGKGVGSKMMKSLFDLLRERGYRQTSLSVQKDNPAVRFYKRLGYKITGERTDHANHEDFLMIKRL